MRISIFYLVVTVLVFTGKLTAAEDEFLTVPFRGGVSIEGYTGSSRHVEVPSTLGGRPVQKIASWVFTGRNLKTLFLPSTLQCISRFAFYGCRDLQSVTFSGSLPKGGDAFAGLSGTLPEVRVWPDCGGEHLAGSYRGLPLRIQSGVARPYAERLDGLPGHLFDDELQLRFPLATNDLILRYARGFDEPDSRSASIASGATLKLTSSTRLALRWFTADGQPASAVRRLSYGQRNASVPASEDFAVRACYCHDAQGRLEIEGYHGLEPVVRIPSEIDGKPVYNLCSSGQWSLQSLAVIIPPGMAHCGYHFAGCSSLEYIEFPQGLRRLTDGTARDCPMLRQVLLPDSLREIGKEAFASCPLLSELELPQQIVSIEEAAFRGCQTLTRVVFPASLILLGPEAFQNCPNLSEILFFGAPPARINQRKIFAESVELIHVLPNLGWGATFDGIPVEVIDEVFPVLVIIGLDNDDRDFFSQTLIVELSIVNASRQGENEIRYETDGTLPGSDSQLYQNPFSIDRDANITAGVFSAGKLVGPIVSRRFAKTDDRQFLSRFTQDESSGVWQYQGGVSVLVLPAEGQKFSGFSGNPERGGTLRAIYLPDSVQNLNANESSTGTSAQNPFFGQRVLKTIEIAPGNDFYQVIDGVLFDISGETLLAYPPAREGESYAVPEGVKWVAAGAFAWNENLTELILPDTIEAIGEGAFREMRQLQQVQLPVGLATLAPFLFQGCSSLRQLTLPALLSGIGRHALQGCQNLEELVLPPFLEHIGSSAFRGCSGLSSLRIPPGIKSLAFSAFFECRENLRLIFDCYVDYGITLYGQLDAQNPKTGEYLLKPLTIEYWELGSEWEWDSWIERFFGILFADNDLPDEVWNLFSFEESGSLTEPPSLEFDFADDDAPNSETSVQIHFQSESMPENFILYYTLDGTEPTPENAMAVPAELSWYYGSSYRINSDWIDVGVLPLVLRARCFDSETSEPLSHEQWLRVSWINNSITSSRMYWNNYDNCLDIDLCCGSHLQLNASEHYSWNDFNEVRAPATEATLTLPDYWNYINYSDLLSKMQEKNSVNIFWGICGYYSDDFVPKVLVLSREFCQFPLPWNEQDKDPKSPNMDFYVSDFATEFRLESPQDSGFYHVEDGVLFHGSTLLAYPGAKEGNLYSIPEGTEMIRKEAFVKNRFDSWNYNYDWEYDEELNEWCEVFDGPPADWVDKTLQEVLVPASVTTIQDDAFSDCWHLQTVRFLGTPPDFAGEEIFPTNAYWWSFVNCVVQAFPGCGWEDLQRRWLKRKQQLQESKTQEEWEDYCSYRDNWTFYGASDLIIEGFKPPEFSMQPDHTLQIRCFDMADQEAAAEEIIIYYTLDETQPNEQSTPYRGAFAVPEECQLVQALAFYQNGQGQASASAQFIVPVELPPAGDPDAPWTESAITTPGGQEALQVPDNAANENRLVRSFAGAGTLLFRWKMDSSAGRLSLLHNGKTILLRQSYMPWELLELSVSSTGNHTFTWVFTPSPSSAPNSPNTAWIGGIAWRSVAEPEALFQHLTVHAGAASGQYRAGQTVEVLPDIHENGTFSRWEILSGLQFPLTGNAFIMPDNEVVLQAVYRYSHSYQLQPGWNLLGNDWLNLEAGENEDKEIFVYDQQKRIFMRKKLVELTARQAFWLFNDDNTPETLNLTGEISEQIDPEQAGWALQAGAAIQTPIENTYHFDAENQKYRMLQEENPDTWQGFWQYIPEN